MRTLTPTLLAAQRSLGGVPSVELRIRDGELRWMPLIEAESSAHLTAACAVSGGILRVRIGPSGTLDAQRITTPDDPEQWQSWTSLASGVATASDVALSTPDGDPARVRVFFVREGGSPYRLSWLQSVDGGISWAAPADLILGLPTAGAGLASASAQLFYHDPGDGYLKLAARGDWDTGAWAVHPWLAAGALPGRHGIAAGYLAGTYYVASCDEDAEGCCRLRTGTCQAATGSWTAPVAVVPPGLPAASAAPAWPSLAYAQGAWHLAYLETLSGALARTASITLHSEGWEHWSYACWVPLQAFLPMRRPALVCHGQALYLAQEDAVWRARLYSPEDGEQSLVTRDLWGYVVAEEPWYGRAVVELRNPGGLYDGLGQAGTPAAALRPLATVVLERGFRTAAGEERVARSPYYIVHAALRRGGGRPGLRLECEDGWGLLRRWRPDALYVWEGKTIAWLIAEVVYRAAGLACAFDESEAWATSLASFAVAPADWGEIPAGWRQAWPGRDARPPGEWAVASQALHATGLGAVRTLLAKASASARWQADGSLYCFVPWTQAIHDPYAVGAAGEVLDALYGRGLAIPNEALVYGEGVAAGAVTYDATSCPRRYLAVCVDPHLRTEAECSGRAGGLVCQGQAGGQTGWIETPCQCGLELLDAVSLEDTAAGALDGAVLRVVGIVERYDPGAGSFTTRASLEGA